MTESRRDLKRARFRCSEDVQYYLQALRVTSWRHGAYGEDWEGISKEAKVL
jgi:hypothetical protein